MYYDVGTIVQKLVIILNDSHVHWDADMRCASMHTTRICNVTRPMVLVCNAKDTRQLAGRNHA